MPALFSSQQVPEQTELSPMKSIDTKSLLIGALLASTMLFGIAATNKTDTWDPKQNWEWRKVLVNEGKLYGGWEVQVMSGIGVTFINDLPSRGGRSLEALTLMSGWEPIEPAGSMKLYSTYNQAGGVMNMVWARKRVQ